MAKPQTARQATGGKTISTGHTAFSVTLVMMTS
jgi:hypothetical protein